MRLSLVMPAFVVALCGATACEPTYPGTALGTYSLVESLADNTCGAGLPALPTVNLEVELRAEGVIGYWRLPRQGSVAGSYREADGAFEFRSSRLIVAWAPDAELNVLGCTVEQREVIRGTVVPTNVGDGAVGDASADGAGGSVMDAAHTDAGADNDGDAGASEPVELLVGEHTIDVAPARGSDCAPLLAVSGGAFDAIPCRARYTISGVASASTF